MVVLTILLSGLTGAVVGTALTIYLQRRARRQQELREGAFQVYQALSILKDMHWQATVLEANGEGPDAQQAEEYQRRAWEIADKLRRVDDVPEAEAILRALRSLDFPSQKDRYDEFGRVLDLLAERLNPKYDKYVKQIRAENQVLMAADLEEWRRRRSLIQYP